MNSEERLRKAQNLNRTVNLMFTRLEKIQDLQEKLDVFSPHLDEYLIEIMANAADLMRLNVIMKERSKEVAAWTDQLLGNTYSMKKMFGDFTTGE